MYYQMRTYEDGVRDERRRKDNIAWIKSFFLVFAACFFALCAWTGIGNLLLG